MKITRYVHSCLLIEDAGLQILVDPGVYSWESGLLQPGALPKVAEVVITHEHPDHCHIPFIEALQSANPELVCRTNAEVAKGLHQAGLGGISTDNSQHVQFFDAPHESMPMGQPPLNRGVHVLGRLTHPGDSFRFEATKDILALPITAPWGSMAQAVELALVLQPKHIIPVHDWHWRPEATAGMYPRLQDIFSKAGITFHIPTDGQAIVIA